MYCLRAWIIGLSLLGLTGCSGGGADEPWSQRKARFEQAAQTAQPLIAAIGDYLAATGRPPPRLSDVAPKYIQQVPATGLQECPAFDYRSFSSRPASLVWYDLGSREGRPLKKPAEFSDGNPEHAIMVFALDTEGRVVSASIDRLPKGLKGADFDSARWKQNDNRMLMALKLSDSYRLNGMPSKVFQDLLGAPDGTRAVENVPWELRINCSTGFLNRDVFFYWPLQKYPPQIYGGEVEQVADWAYVHD
jgi:hypothetical protein